MNLLDILLKNESQEIFLKCYHEYVKQAEMIDMVTRLDEILKRIQTGMRHTNNPFSMFYKPDSVIEIEEKVQDLSYDELTPIMSI